MDVNRAKEEIIERLGVKESTFYTWLRRYGEILEREGIVKFAEKGDRKTLVEIDVERFIEFIKNRSKSPKVSFKVEEIVIKTIEERLMTEDVIIIDSPKIFYDYGKFFFPDFIVLSGNNMFIYEIKYSPKAEDFLYFLYELKNLREKLPFEIKGCYCIVTDKEIDSSIYKILLDLKSKRIDVNVLICKFKDLNRLKKCAEKFSLPVLKMVSEEYQNIDLENIEIFDFSL